MLMHLYGYEGSILRKPRKAGECFSTCSSREFGREYYDGAFAVTMPKRQGLER